MYYEKVILSISAMLFVGAASYASRLVLLEQQSSLVGQTGTHKMHKLSNWNRTEFKDQTNDQQQ
jgi:hypothetical protein